MKQNCLYLILICFWASNLRAQTDKDNYIIEYNSYLNDSQIELENPIVLIGNSAHTLLSKRKEFEKKNATYPLEEIYIDRVKNTTYTFSQLDLKTRIGTAVQDGSSEKGFTSTNQTKFIHGYKCKKATATLAGEFYEFWYTQESPIAGSPVAFGSQLGLVLEVKRNNQLKITAAKISKNIPFDYLSHIKLADTPIVDLEQYQEKIWLSRFQTYSIFKDETVGNAVTRLANDSIFTFAKGTVLVRKINLANLQSGNQVFLDVALSPIKDGKDRVGSVFLIPNYGASNFLQALEFGIDRLPVYTGGNGRKNSGIAATSDFSPLVELMRFHTPMSSVQSNAETSNALKSTQALNYRHDISELAPLFTQREVYIGLFIATDEPKSHSVSAHITVHNAAVERLDPNFIMPLFNTVNIMQEQGQEYPSVFASEQGLKVSFELEKPVDHLRLRLITTGHGNWDESDAFSARENRIYLNGKAIFGIKPWRTDCGSFLAANRASKALVNGLHSSDLSRSNWCPASTSLPFEIPLGKLPAGKHYLELKIDQGQSRGRFYSYWYASGVLIGDQ